jgi:penicillin-binding protein 1A
MRWFARLLSWPITLLLNLLLGASLAAVGIYAWIAPGLPDEQEILAMRLQQPLRVYSADGLLLAEFGAERREPLAYADTPPLLIKAFLAAEDARFFEHPGIDIQGLLRAARNLLETGTPSQGGSTITMQVARNFFLTPEKTFRRKLTELALALRLETRLDKQRIFELYQNKIFFGHRAYGIAAAARTYYNRTPAQLSLAQMAMLAGVPQAPSVNNPVSRPRQARERRAYVLGRMLALGYIDQAAHDAALAAPDAARLSAASPELDAPYAAEMARREILARHGEAAYTAGLRVVTTLDSRLQRAANNALREALLEYDRRHGLRPVEARLAPARLTDPAARDALLAEHPPVNGLHAALVLTVEANQARLYRDNGDTLELPWNELEWAARYVAPDRRKAAPKRMTQVLEPGQLVRLELLPGGDWRLAQIPAVQGALVALSPLDGAVQALVGGFDFERNQFNRAVDAQRQPGSGFKPFVYAAALDQGWTPASLVQDSPLRVRDGSGRIWTPKNFDGRYLGPIRLREALVKSRNLATVHLLRAIGLDDLRKFLPRFGLDPEHLPRGLSLGLGSGAASPWQMAGAYARFANGGFAVTPYLIQRVEDAHGRPLFRASPRLACPQCDDPQARGSRPLAGPRAERVLEPRLVYQMRSMLADVIRAGTGRRALALKRNDLAGKTGTSNDVRDSWFNGFNSQLVASVWMGFDDYSPLGRRETGGRAALSLWVKFMGAALAGQPEDLPPEPPGLVHLRINRHSGALSYGADPDAISEAVREEYGNQLAPAAVPTPANDYEYLSQEPEPSPGAPQDPYQYSPYIPPAARVPGALPRRNPERPAEAGGLLQQLF